MASIRDVIQAGYPGATESETDQILFGMTEYPFAGVPAKKIYAMASRLRRATAKGYILCEHCFAKTLDPMAICPRCSEKLIALWGPRKDKNKSIFG